MTIGNDKGIRHLWAGRLRKVLRWFEHLLAGIGLCFIVYQAFFELSVMTSGSMAPALRGESYESGDRFLVEKVTRLIRSPKRWEIHFFYDEEGTPVAKRIVGLPGERISIKNKRILVNGLPVELPRSLSTLKYYPFGNLAAGREVDCGNGYFVLGDDSRDSHDSRFVGPIEERRFRGRVWCVLWPWSRAGFVTVSENRKTAGGKVVSLEDIPRVARASQSRACGTE